MTLGHQQDHPAPLPVAERRAPAPAALAIDTDQPIECIAVAASTGGIPAFAKFLAHLDPRISAPILLRSEEHTSELQSLMRISYAVSCLKKTILLHTTQRQNLTPKD